MIHIDGRCACAVKASIEGEAAQLRYLVISVVRDLAATCRLYCRSSNIRMMIPGKTKLTQQLYMHLSEPPRWPVQFSQHQAHQLVLVRHLTT